MVRPDLLAFCPVVLFSQPALAVSLVSQCWRGPSRGGRREPETTRGTATPAPAQICAEQKHICYCSRCSPQRHVPYFIFNICAWANPCEHARSLLFTHAVFSKLLRISKPDTKQTPILPSTGRYAESPLFSQWVQWLSVRLSKTFPVRLPRSPYPPPPSFTNPSLQGKEVKQSSNLSPFPNGKKKKKNFFQCKTCIFYCLAHQIFTKK